MPFTPALSHFLLKENGTELVKVIDGPGVGSTLMGHVLIKEHIRHLLSGGLTLPESLRFPACY